MWTVRSPMMVFPTIAFGLGTWQVYRYERKKKMLAHREARRSAPASQLPADVDVKESEFRHFVVHGQFDHVRMRVPLVPFVCEQILTFLLSGTRVGGWAAVVRRRIGVLRCHTVW